MRNEVTPLMPRIDQETVDETAEIDDSPQFDGPIKVRWNGYARTRIAEYNTDFADEGWEDHFYRPSIYVRTMSRQKTNVVLKTVREAECVRYELDSYAGGKEGRVWVNSSISRSFDRVQSEIDEAMRERGYEPDFSDRGTYGLRTFLGYVEVDG